MCVCLRVCVCVSDCQGTHYVDQAGIKLRDPPSLASAMLGLKVCTTIPGLGKIIFILLFSPYFSLVFFILSLSKWIPVSGFI